MNEDRCASLCHSLEERSKRRIGQETVIDVGTKPDADQAELVETAMHLRDGGVGILQGDRAESEEPLRMLRDDDCHLIVYQSAELRRRI